MREVLLIDVALWGALIMMAALIIIRRWRRSHSRVPARGPRREAPELAGQKISAPKAASMTRPGQDGRAPGGAAPKPARPPPPAAPPQGTQMTHPKTRLRRPGAQRDRRQASTRAATPSERIVSYYDHADQPIADYLAALGWTQQPSAPSVGQHAQMRIPRQRPPTARPAP
jgi:hypothetical protein